VKDDNHPYLAYSPKTSIENSSKPFRAFLGSILSVVEDFPVACSTYSPDMQLDTIEEEDDDDDHSQENDDDGSGPYRGRLGGGAAAGHSTTRSQTHDGRENTESDLMVRLPWPISITWLAHPLSGYFIFPQIARILPSMGSSLYHVEQHARSSRVQWKQQTTPMAYPLSRIRINWQRLAMPF
jgi:hypothetical protein